ncbi:TonB-dependent siderophore receptor [Parasphingorhabdus cellanae]|uniref:TonB-dependent siderophore receptor n=1 Tax=Parasphingorhabdus cellanae TaxID=2806553 RepID=A0ABX7T6P3_9SPHN|nr:TonB-dependent siderophore receptor [Parasphingorhabdus cellanae]QTD56801.1 TonB-dependent siderophore receptor [Parasphingorhabdus cellanae]
MIRKFLLAATALTFSNALYAQDQQKSQTETDNEEDVIIVTGQLSDFGALKSATPIVETARSVTIETEDHFRDKGALTLDDVLNYIPGVVGDTFGFATRGDFPQVRGFDAAEYRDGQQVLFGFYNNTRSDVYVLEQVEVLKGPASVLYGKGTPGGIVNAVSKLAGPDKQSELVVDVGTFDRYQAAADLNAEISDSLFVRFVGLYRDSNTQIGFVDDDAIIAMPSITYDDGRTRLTAMLEYVDRDSDTAQQFLPLTGTGCVSGDVTITPAAVCVNSSGEEVELDTYLGDPDFNRYDTNSILVSLLASHNFTENFSVDGIFRYKDADVDYRQSYIDFLGPIGPPRVDANGDGGRTFFRSNAFSKQAAFDLRARWAFNTGPIEHELFGGFAYQNVKIGNEFIFLSDPANRRVGAINIYNPVYGNIPPALFDDANFSDLGDTVTDDYGLYLNNQMSIGDLKLNFGFRYDDSRTESDGNVQKDDAVSFSVGALYAFDGGISPYVSFAESFEPVIGTDGLTNNPLKPREGKQWEVGIKYQPPGTRTYITFAYFDIEESNLPNPSSLINQPNSQQEGVGKVKGFELQAQTTLGDWYLELNGSLLDTETADGVPFASIPEEQASAWVQYQPSFGSWDGFKLGFGLRYVGENESNGTGAVGPIRVVTDGNILGDFLLGYETENWDVTFNVRNITNEKYFATCLARGDCFVGEERTAVVRVAYRF